MARARSPNRAQLSLLGFELGARAPGGQSQGAWFATTSAGKPVVLKRLSEDQRARHEALRPSLEELRERGAPVPEYLSPVNLEGGTLSVQRRLPGRSLDTLPRAVVHEVAAAISAQSGLAAPPPLREPSWGEFVVRTLRCGQPDWGQHGPLRSWDPRSAKVLQRAQAVGANVSPELFPVAGMVHLDLHTDNVLVEAGRLTGIIDWEDACSGDPRYDLVQFVFDLEGHGQGCWGLVEAIDWDMRVLRSYLGLLVLKCTSAAIQFRPEDVPRQLARAERVFERYRVS